MIFYENSLSFPGLSLISQVFTLVLWTLLELLKMLQRIIIGT